MLVTARMLFSPLVESDTVHTSVIGLCFLFEESAKSKMSIYRVSVIELWKKTEEGEKKKVLREFISEHGEHYTHDELLNYQEKKYRSRLSPYTLPISSKEQEH